MTINKKTEETNQTKKTKNIKIKITHGLLAILAFIVGLIMKSLRRFSVKTPSGTEIKGEFEPEEEKRKPLSESRIQKVKEEPENNKRFISKE
ncbi:hypothetical protein [Candidatus Pyrohabitans sp.]